MTTSERRALHTYLEPDTYEGWQHVSSVLGCSLSAITEQMGRDFLKLINGRPIAEMESSEFFDKDFIRKCRAIDAERRRR